MKIYCRNCHYYSLNTGFCAKKFTFSYGKDPCTGIPRPTITKYISSHLYIANKNNDCPFFEHRKLYSGIKNSLFYTSDDLFYGELSKKRVKMLLERYKKNKSKRRTH